MAEQEPTAPAPEQNQETSVADNPTNTNTEQATAPEQNPVDLGLTPAQAERFKKFVDNNGGFDNAFKKLKVDVSTSEPKPEASAQDAQGPAQAPEAPKNPEAPTSPQTPPTPPAGAVTQQEMMDMYYFDQLSKQEKYAPIAKEIADGSLLKEMASLGIDIHNADGSYNDAKINTYLGIKAQTVPAKPTGSEPDASAAPTVSYTPVGDEIKSMEEARTVLTQQGHPSREKAMEFIKKTLNPAQNTGQDKKSGV